MILNLMELKQVEDCKTDVHRHWEDLPKPSKGEEEVNQAKDRSSGENGPRVSAEEEEELENGRRETEDRKKSENAGRKTDEA